MGALTRNNSGSEVPDLIEAVTGKRPDPRKLRIVTDTGNFMQIDYGDVVEVGGDLFLVNGVEREGRFGLDDEPKHWVKKVVDLRTGQRKVLKMAYFETFQGRVGSLEYNFYRSPRKEGRILDMVRGNPHFMQGYSLLDDGDNVLRVIDYVLGKPLSLVIDELEVDHETYFYTLFPPILESFARAVEAVGSLHKRGEVHGDIRRDHLFVETSGGRYVWIDFDYAYESTANKVGFDMFGLGNILAFLVGKGDVTLGGLKEHSPDVHSLVRDDDLNIVFGSRVANLRKIYPYVPESLNRVLLHFSRGAEVFYETVDEMAHDLRSCSSELPWG